MIKEWVGACFRKDAGGGGGERGGMGSEEGVVSELQQCVEHSGL